MTEPGRKSDGEALIRNDSGAYGQKFQDHLLEQYKIYVDSAQKVSEKRISASNYLLTVSSSLLTLFGVVVAAHSAGKWLAIIPAAGLLVALAWYATVRSYKDLNTAKFKVIHELENFLPAALFAYEWQHCEGGKGTAYKPITHVERWIPGVFALIYLALGVLAIVGIPAKDETPSREIVSGALDLSLKQPVYVQSQTLPNDQTPSSRPAKRK